MENNLTARLARLKNYATRYEVVAHHPDGRRVLVGYTSRRSRPGLFAAVRNGPVAVALVKYCGATDIRFARTGVSAVIGTWTVDFSGRTQRESIIAGELPFVCDVAD